MRDDTHRKQEGVKGEHNTVRAYDGMIVGSGEYIYSSTLSELDGLHTFLHGQSVLPVHSH